MKQMHQKDREDQEEEMEDVRQSCQKRVRKQLISGYSCALEAGQAQAWHPLPSSKGGAGSGDGLLGQSPETLASWMLSRVLGWKYLS